MDDNLPEWVQWVSGLAPAGTFVVAITAALVAWRALRQRTLADARHHWWERTRWAIERAQGRRDESVEQVAIEILQLQAASDLAREPELLIMDAIQEPILNAYFDRLIEHLPKDTASAPEYSVREEPQEQKGGTRDDDERHTES